MKILKEQLLRYQEYLTENEITVDFDSLCELILDAEERGNETIECNEMTCEVFPEIIEYFSIIGYTEGSH
jgi:hypothetical protein